jgi:hypothetical protein
MYTPAKLGGLGMTRIKAGILVSAALRCANETMIDCVLQHRGDPDAGAIFVHIDALDGRHQIVARSLGLDGTYSWRIITSTEWIDADAAKVRLEKELALDPDAFIVAVIDRDARNPFLLF